jgi:stearoyl-CoA desaturase (delta-9 desaturase)
VAHPLFALPTQSLGWALVGVASVGLYAIADDCGHDHFFTSETLNRVVGTLCLLPLLYPLESWRLHHGGAATARAAKPAYRVLIPVYWAMDLARGLAQYFDLDQFEAQLLDRARGSVLVVYAFMAIFFPLVCYYGGLWTLTKFYLGPLFAFHLVKSLFMHGVTPVQSDGVGVTFNTVRLPALLDWLSHGCGFQVPAYLAIRVPCYNLREARTLLALSAFADRFKMSRLVEHVRQSLFAAPRREQREQFERAQTYRASVEAAARVKQLHGAAAASAKASAEAASAGRDVQSRLKPLREFTFTAEGVAGLQKFIRKELNWVHCALLLSTPVIGLYGLLTVQAHAYTWLFAVVWYFMTGLGITGGYHRLWAHRAYDATWPVRFVLLCWSSGAVEGSALWWCRDHRAHHRYTDTDKDPYSIKNGFFYAHMGWMLLAKEKTLIGKADMSDLEADAMLQNQHKYYALWALFFGFVFPTVVCGVGWGDWAGGYFIAAVARLVFVHHATFCVNSLAHYVGEKTYADKNTPRDHFFTALMTLGEGYHNFHHEFPQDYRNAIKSYQYDPTKVLIRTLAFFGLAYNLHRFPSNEIRKGRFQIDSKRLAKAKKRIDWGPPPASLPVMTRDQVQQAAAAEPPRQLMVLDDIVYDIADFAPKHPGGKIIAVYVGKDATEAFDGGVYAHSNAARNMLDTMRVARLPTMMKDADRKAVKYSKFNNDNTPLDAYDDDEDDDDATSTGDDAAVAHKWLVEHAAQGHDGPLSHVNVARMQEQPITKSPYEIDFPITTTAKPKDQ